MADVIRLKFEVPHAPSFGVFARLPAEDVDLKQVAIAWVERHAPDGLREMLTKYIASPVVMAMARPRASMPALPPHAFQAPRVGPDERARHDASSHVVLVRGLFPVLHPPIAALGALAVAYGLADAFDGVAMDPDFPRLLPLAALREPFMAHGLSVSEHVICPRSSSPTGQWVTTHGLGRFGLPNLELVDVPEALGEAMAPFLMAVAQALLRRVAELTDAGQAAKDELPLEAELEVDARDVAGAFGRDDMEAGTCRVSLCVTNPAPSLGDRVRRLFGKKSMVANRASLLRVGPPGEQRGELGTWYGDALTSLFRIAREGDVAVDPTAAPREVGG